MSKERSFDAEDPGLIHHFTRTSGPLNDFIRRQSSNIQPSRFARKPETGSRSRDDIEKEGLEPVRPRSPTTVLSAAAAPIPAPEKPSSHGPSASRPFQESSDRSNSFRLPDPARTLLTPGIIPTPAPSPPQTVHGQDNDYFASRQFIPGLIPPSHPRMPAPYFAPSRPETMSYNVYPSGIRSVPPASSSKSYSAYNPGIQSVPLPSWELPHFAYNPNARFVPPSRELPDTMYDSGPHPVLLPSRQILSNMYDSGPYSESAPLRPLQRTPHAKDAPIAVSLPGISSQPPVISAVIPSQPPNGPSQPPIVTSQPPILPPVIPSQPPVLPSVIPSQPPVIMPVILPHRLSPMSTPTPMPPPQDIPDSERVPIGPLSPIPELEDALHSPSLAIGQPSSDPVPSEYPNEYGADLQDDSNLGQLPYSYRPRPPRFIPQTRSSFTQITGEFVTKTLPTQVYLYFLLRFPSLYFFRVARLFEEANLTLSEIKRIALDAAAKDMVPDDFYAMEFANAVPRQYMRFESRWESFIDSVVREWKTFNIISVFLLSAILTILQIQSAEQDPIIRYTALASSICALISLLFGCLYIVGFGSMRKPYKAAEWALEARTTRSTVWWNVWVFLAMPAICLVWSIILYIACIMTFIWRTTSQDVSPPLIMSETTVLVIRVVLSSVLALGILYATLILSTFRRYGETMDKAWKKRVLNLIHLKMENYGQGPPVPVQHDSAPPLPMYPATPEVVVPYVSSPTHIPHAPSPSPPSTPIGAPSRYTGSDHEIPSSYAPPSTREESRNPSGREREKGPAPTSADGPVFSSREPLGSPPSSHLGDNGRRTIRKEPDHEPSSALPQVPMKIYIPQADLPKGAQKQKKRRISVPPALNLPTIPPTPGSSTLSYTITPVFADSSPTTGESSRRLHDQNDATTNSEEIEEPRWDSRVRAGFQQQPIQRPPTQPSVVLPDAILVQRQLEAPAENQRHISGPPAYVYDPLYTYTDPNAQAWALYYAQGGKDPTGTVYFHFVPGVAPRQPAAAEKVSQSQPAVEARPTEQEQQQQRQQKI